MDYSERLDDRDTPAGSMQERYNHDYQAAGYKHDILDPNNNDFQANYNLYHFNHVDNINDINYIDDLDHIDDIDHDDFKAVYYSYQFNDYHHEFNANCYGPYA